MALLTTAIITETDLDHLFQVAVPVSGSANLL